MNLVRMVFVGLGYKRSISLRQFMENEGLLPSPEVEIKRRNAIDKLKEIVMKWAKRVANQRQFPQSCIGAASATILIYGSCGLGVHNNESEIDALCVGPCFASMAEDFFVDLRDMLASTPEVSEILGIKYGRVPLRRFNFDGISVNLSYAKIDTIFAPENVLDPFFLANIDEISWRSFSSVCVSESILNLVPNLKLYQSLLRAVKFWARRRGVYANDAGFFGEVHLVVLAAFVCRGRPHTTLSALVSIFFKTFAFWPWPKPVTLEDDATKLQRNDDLVKGYKMPIQLPRTLRPCSSNEYCYCGTSRSTFNRIVKELRKAYARTKDFRMPDFEWEDVFAPFSHARKYDFFLKACLSSTNQKELKEWVGRVKSRFCYLVFIVLNTCHPNPREYLDNQLLEPHVVFYWGLILGRDEFSLNCIKDDFMKNIFTGYDGPVGGMELTVVLTEFESMVEESESGTDYSVIEASFSV